MNAYQAGQKVLCGDYFQYTPMRMQLDGANIGRNPLTSLHIYPTSAILKYSVI